jgi:N6-L-threonylcarbamoyladenine synthase
LLGFEYPGGPVMDRLAAYGNPSAVKFTLARMKGNELDFSFSGLKTGVVRWTQQHDIKDEIEKRRGLQRPTLDELLSNSSKATLDLIASFQYTVIEELLSRLINSAEQIGAESVIVAGGVACNAGLQARAMRESGLPIYFPSHGLATDNAAMIAAAAFPKLERQEFAGFDLRAQPSLMLA